MPSLKKLEISKRPREKLICTGAKNLTDIELIAILLGSGTRNHDVLSVSLKLQQLVDCKNLKFSVEELLSIPGLGPAKACAVIAAFELARRRIKPDGVKIRGPEDILPLVAHLADRKQETFICISLNGANEVIMTRVVTIGLANLCQVHPREVLADPLQDRACAVIVAHNHPSGDLTPSTEDLRVTERLKEASTILGLKLLDHIIFSHRGIRSLFASGWS